MTTLIILAAIISSLLAILPQLVAPKANNYEKRSAYECGFEPFGTTKAPFDIHFYVVAMLFLIFDLEISYLFP
jgi:NADH-quinone oxidoreductase subunit A